MQVVVERLAFGRAQKVPSQVCASEEEEEEPDSPLGRFVGDHLEGALVVASSTYYPQYEVAVFLMAAAAVVMCLTILIEAAAELDLAVEIALAVQPAPSVAETDATELAMRYPVKSCGWTPPQALTVHGEHVSPFQGLFHAPVEPSLLYGRFLFS